MEYCLLSTSHLLTTRRYSARADCRGEVWEGAVLSDEGLRPSPYQSDSEWFLQAATAVEWRRLFCLEDRDLCNTGLLLPLPNIAPNSGEPGQLFPPLPVSACSYMQVHVWSLEDYAWCCSSRTFHSPWFFGIDLHCTGASEPWGSTLLHHLALGLLVCLTAPSFAMRVWGIKLGPSCSQHKLVAT